MKFEIKFKSIAVRWFLNTFLIIAAAILAIAIAFCLLFNSMYLERIESIANDFAYEFTSLSNTDASTFDDAAFNLASEFQYKNKLEVQVIDSDDRVVVSTTGFQSTDDPMLDYFSAKENGSSVCLESTTADGESGTTNTFSLAASPSLVSSSASALATTPRSV